MFFAACGYHTLFIKLLLMTSIVFFRVETEVSGRKEDSPIIVLFTGISQSVVKNLKQVRTHVNTHYFCVCISYVPYVYY